jgi:hypothetical protein
MASAPKFLVRVWLPVKGCVHMRSTAMTEAEARELLNAAVGAIEVAQESGMIEEVFLKKGRAFVKARRMPDPDQPGRTTPGFILVSIPDPDTFLRDAVASEFDALLRFAVNKVLDTASPFLVRTSDLSPQDWKPLDLGGTTPLSGSELQTPKRNQWLRGTIAVSLVLVAICFLRGLFRKTVPSADNPPSALTSRQDGSYDPETENWRLAREQIRDLLKEPWADKLLGEKTTSGTTDRELLSRFAQLFKRPDQLVEETLTKKSFGLYKKQVNQNHPFVAFLNRLPISIPDLPKKEILSPGDAMRYLETLGNKLKASEIALDLNNPDRLSQDARFSLDYVNFFDNWHLSRESPKLLDKKWDRSDDDLVIWEVEIRKFIRDCYPYH